MDAASRTTGGRADGAPTENVSRAADRMAVRGDHPVADQVRAERAAGAYGRDAQYGAAPAGRRRSACRPARAPGRGRRRV
jgi:hypothetical protein